MNPSVIAHEINVTNAAFVSSLLSDLSRLSLKLTVLQGQTPLGKTSSFLPVHKGGKVKQFLKAELPPSPNIIVCTHLVIFIMHPQRGEVLDGQVRLKGCESKERITI